MGTIEAVFTDATCCADSAQVVFPSNAICECGFVTLKTVSHAHRQIECHVAPRQADARKVTC